MSNINEIFSLFENDLRNNKIETVRVRLGNYAIAIREFDDKEKKEFTTVVNMLKRRRPDIFEGLKEPPKFVSKTKKEGFTVEDFDAAIYGLKENLCDERIEEVMRIGHALYSRIDGSETRKKEDSKKETKSASNNQSNDKLVEGAPGKHYKANEVVNVFRLKDVLNRSLKLMKIMNKRLDNTTDDKKIEEMKTDLKTIKAIYAEAKFIMKKSLGFKQKTTTESIQFLYDQREKNIENYLNESFEMCDKLFKVLDKCNDMTLNESIGEKVKAFKDTAIKAIKALIKKLEPIGWYLLSIIKNATGANRIKEDGKYLDIDKALNIIENMMSKYN